MTDSELTDEMITVAMAKAEKRACPPADNRCYAFPDPLHRPCSDISDAPRGHSA
jgi:hypothetical protein